MTPITQHEVNELATQFAMNIRDYLARDTMRDVNQGTTDLHDVCDPNHFMILAWEAIYDEWTLRDDTDPTLLKQRDELVERAWNRAQECDFDPRKIRGDQE